MHHIYHTLQILCRELELQNCKLYILGFRLNCIISPGVYIGFFLELGNRDFYGYGYDLLASH